MSTYTYILAGSSYVSVLRLLSMVSFSSLNILRIPFLKYLSDKPNFSACSESVSIVCFLLPEYGSHFF